MKHIMAFIMIVVMTPDLMASETTKLKGELKQLKNQYQKKLRALEQRIKKLERREAAAKRRAQKQQAQAKATTKTATGASRTGTAARRGASAFNPSISLVLIGTGASFRQDPDNYRMPGFVLGEETGPGSKGLSLGESELVISANIDHRFFGRMTIAVTPENEVEVEEAFIKTLAMPGGLSLQFGRMFSGVGYFNSKHAHSWQFVDAPLVYRALMGNQYRDDGIQLRWLAPTDTFLELGVEAFRGDSFPAGGSANDGIGAYTLFVKAGGDIGWKHSWKAGAWYYAADVVDRDASSLVFNGETEITGIELTWKTSLGKGKGNRKLIWNTEWLRRKEDGFYTGFVPRYNATQSGWYTQLIYQGSKKWRTGLRYGTMSADNPGAAFAATELDPSGHRPERTSLMFDYAFSEFSRIRLQYNHDNSYQSGDRQFFIQYIMSMGAHGAHGF